MKLIGLAVTIAAVVGGVVLFVGAASGSAPANPPATIVGTPSSDGSSVTWTITVTQNAGHDAEFALIFPTHPAGSSTTGLPVHVIGNGSASFTQSGTKCGATADVDLLMADLTFSDLAGSITVGGTCDAPPTTTTTTTTQPDSPPTTTSLPSPTTPASTSPALPNITQEQQQVQVAPGVTGGDG